MIVCNLSPDGMGIVHSETLSFGKQFIPHVPETSSGCESPAERERAGVLTAAHSPPTVTDCTSSERGEAGHVYELRMLKTRNGLLSFKAVCGNRGISRSPLMLQIDRVPRCEDSVHHNFAWTKMNRNCTAAVVMLSASLVLTAAAADANAPDWALDLNNRHIPEAPASGRIHGQPFTLTEAILQNGVLTLREGDELHRVRALQVMMLYKQNEDPHGRKWSVNPDEHGGGLQMIQLLWKKMPPDSQEKDNQTITAGYAMRLELGTRKDGKCQGKIYICLPDREQSVVGGTFEVQEK